MRPPDIVLHNIPERQVQDLLYIDDLLLDVLDVIYVI